MFGSSLLRVDVRRTFNMYTRLSLVEAPLTKARSWRLRSDSQSTEKKSTPPLTTNGWCMAARARTGTRASNNSRCTESRNARRQYTNTPLVEIPRYRYRHYAPRCSSSFLSEKNFCEVASVAAYGSLATRNITWMLLSLDALQNAVWSTTKTPWYK